MEGEALAALWAVGAGARESAVPASYLNGRAHPAVLTALRVKGLVANEGRVWWLTVEGWEAGSVAASENGLRRSE